MRVCPIAEIVHKAGARRVQLVDSSILVTAFGHQAGECVTSQKRQTFQHILCWKALFSGLPRTFNVEGPRFRCQKSKKSRWLHNRMERGTTADSLGEWTGQTGLPRQNQAPCVRFRRYRSMRLLGEKALRRIEWSIHHRGLESG